MKKVITLTVVISLTLFLCDCGGSKGDAGPAGAAGAQGQAGATGTAGLTVTSDIKCNTTSSGLNLGFIYEIVQFTGGTKFVTCSIYSTSETHSQSHYWPTSQSGNTNGTCLLTNDVDTASSGYWNFSYSNGTAQAVYTDSSSVNNGATITFPSCTVVQ